MFFIGHWFQDSDRLRCYKLQVELVSEFDVESPNPNSFDGLAAAVLLQYL